jgi:peptidoglycan/LPS O-acetylase OafA/YrhL
MLLRNRQIDFLRGIAIILVLLRHRNINEYLFRYGWVGVDLFFVLSGFLVGGLLLAEYKTFGNIKPLHFLARRGFKIYPGYYVLILVRVLYLVWLTWDGKLVFYRNHVWNNVLFIQNYYPNILGPTWSLAVEEHFYFLLAGIIWLAAGKKLIDKGPFFISFCLAILVIELVLRLLTLHYLPLNYVRNIFPTHLRLDSLMAGVLLAWFFHFRGHELNRFYYRTRVWAWPLAIACIVPPAFIAVDSWYMLSFGFTFHYLGFGYILLGFITDSQIVTGLNKYLSPLVYKAIWKTGLYSYGIYLWHSVASNIFLKLLNMAIPQLKYYPVGQHFLYFGFSVGMGIVMTISLENYFPRRVK